MSVTRGTAFKLSLVGKLCPQSLSVSHDFKQGELHFLVKDASVTTTPTAGGAILTTGESALEREAPLILSTGTVDGPATTAAMLLMAIGMTAVRDVSCAAAALVLAANAVDASSDGSDSCFVQVGG